MVLGVADGVRDRLGRPPAGGTDLGRLCREPFPTRAERQRQSRRRPPVLSWDVQALFACHPTRPLDRLTGAGLLWRISGGKITAMQSDWATIEIDGAQRIIHRRPSPANFVLPWRGRAP